MKVLKKFKEKWPKTKERIVNACKFILTAVIMVMGFWVIYSIIWMRLGFPMNNIALWLLFGQSVISEIIFFRWLSN